VSEQVWIETSRYHGLKCRGVEVCSFEIKSRLVYMGWNVCKPF